MPKFKNPISNEIIEVTEEFAEQVLRPQGKYTEVFEETKPAAEVVKPKYVMPKTGKKKSKKKTVRKV